MKVALVTGANRGIGFETAKQLAQNNFKVYMGCRNEEHGIKAQDELRSIGLNVEFVKIDVNSTKDVRNFLNHLKENKEEIELLVNNAGVFLESDGPADTSSSSIFKVDPVIILKTIETNTMGPLKLIQSILPQMIQQNSGRVINISSGMGQLQDMKGHWPGYRMSKTALNALTCIVDDEVADYNIFINSVCPGWVRTDMGGDSATRSIEEGVETIIWLATCENPPRGKFVRDKEILDW
jgi:NAD(P)-dependent dehydrogenase (short-subunit alcohol dehydrogenase family)